MIQIVIETITLAAPIEDILQVTKSNMVSILNS